MDSSYQAYAPPRHSPDDPALTHDYPYPPNPTASYGHNNTHSTPVKPEEERVVGRTPSPTPSEERALKGGVFDWHTLGNWRFWIRREWIWYYVALVVILVITALVTLYHKQIVDWLTPVTRWLHDLKFGWLVPIGVLFVISFPPLFGHEIVAILCGLVWGLWIGFAIVSAGTFLGEVGNFYAFKYCCRARGEKMERTNITYACLAQTVRDGGFKIALIARLSAIPGHFTTAVFSTCGMGIIVFSIAAILSMPKQFITVYLGVILEQSSTGVTDKKSRIISDVVLAVTFVITVLAMWYIFRQMNKVKPQVIYERRKARQAKIARASSTRYGTSFSSESTVTLGPNDLDNIPLTAQAHPNGSYQQQWNQDIYAPKPVRVGQSPMPDVENATPDYRYGGYPGRASTDDVGWDMNAQPTLHARPEDTYGMPYASAESVQHVGRHQVSGSSSSSSPIPPGPGAQPPTDGGLAPPRDERWNSRQQVSGSLSGHSPSPTLVGHASSGHGQEATDVSYRTAVSSHSGESSMDAYGGLYSHPAPAPPPLQRTLSPPPPSYRTDIR